MGFVTRPRRDRVPCYGIAVTRARRPGAAPTVGEAKTWTFFTNHAHVLFCIAIEPGLRIREMAERVGITERAAQRIVAELEEAGYVRAKREGRRKSYRVNRRAHLRHAIEGHRTIGELLDVVARTPE